MNATFHRPRRARRHLLDAARMLVFVLIYVLLDWASYIHPLYGLNITPWNPAIAVGLVFLLRFGARGAAPLFVAIVIAEVWVRGMPAPLAVTVGLSFVLTAGYTAMGLLLRRFFPERWIFEGRRGLFVWIGVVAAGTFVTAIAFVSAATFAALVPADGWSDALVRFWVGDAVGILVSMPLLWMLSEERGRALLAAVIQSWETAAYILLIVVSLWVAFGMGAATDVKYFYVLFLPIVWAAARQGLPGAVLSAALGQAGIIVAVQQLGFRAATVLEIQMLALALALVGFFVGLVTDEQRRMSSELRQTLRIAAAGEMAGALAHELNQPLTAIAAYGTACRQLLREGDPRGQLSDVIERMVSESVRAADVLRRLRDFFRTGSMRLEPLRVAQLIATATGAFEERARRDRVALDVPAAAESALLLADRTQLEIVLRNLLANAFDAVAGRAVGQRWVRIVAAAEPSQRLRITVEDSGPGVSGASAARIFDPFQSNKSSGLGLGLAISRAIVEAHGGELWTEVADHGVFTLLLPLEQEILHGLG